MVEIGDRLGLDIEPKGIGFAGVLSGENKKTRTEGKRDRSDTASFPTHR
jgi:hypothetical protein